ncbi:MAG: aminoglycoside phosphotransferase family protein [Rubrobacter sp.]|nr:aminoglycoside phosphotransferase family protein [Rubrobacter sp.]MDQ3639714.1 aminoglycoside phosphotransferase family protein [Actinomycetota bacterium]
MREVFQRHLLRSPGGKEYQIRECQVSVRYRQATHCLLQYTLRLEEPGTGREQTQWANGVIHAKSSRTRRKWEELRRSRPERTVRGASTAFEPFFYVPELEMLVQVFPHDRWLPSLPLLIEGPPPELEPLLLARFGRDDWRTEAWDVEPVRYRAEKRITLRLTMRAREAASDRTEEKRFYAKVYREEEKEEGEQIYRVLRALWERAEAGGEGFTVGRPVAYLSSLRALIQEEAPGISLWDVLLGGDEANPAVREAARALAVLHLDEEVPMPRRRRPEEEVATLKKRGETLRRACPQLGPEIEEIVGAVIAGFGEEGAPTAPTHGDLHAQHILLDGGRPALIDFDAFAEADPLPDVARVLASLATAPHRASVPHDLANTPHRSPISHVRAREAAQTFAEEYFSHVPEAWRERLPLHYASAVLTIAGHPLRYLAPGWPDKVEAMVKEAKDSLAGKFW